MKDNRLLQFLKKYWVIGVFALTALGAVFSSVEIYKEEVLNIDPDIKYETRYLVFRGRADRYAQPADFAE